jgi:hypothetical protein
MLVSHLAKHWNLPCGLHGATRLARAACLKRHKAESNHGRKRKEPIEAAEAPAWSGVPGSGCRLPVSAGRSSFHCCSSFKFPAQISRASPNCCAAAPAPLDASRRGSQSADLFTLPYSACRLKTRAQVLPSPKHTHTPQRRGEPPRLGECSRTETSVTLPQLPSFRPCRRPRNSPARQEI